MQNQNENRKYEHLLTINKKTDVHLTNVESVVAFSPTRIALTLADGTKTFVVGTNLKITAFSKEDGIFKANGTVTGVSYASKSFSAKIFK